VFKEDVAPVVAAQDDMIEAAGDEQPWLSGHLSPSGY
jgi:hypothetical protein